MARTYEFVVKAEAVAQNFESAQKKCDNLKILVEKTGEYSFVSIKPKEDPTVK